MEKTPLPTYYPEGTSVLNALGRMEQLTLVKLKRLLLIKLHLMYISRVLSVLYVGPKRLAGG